MLGHAAARQPAPMLAMRPIGLRLRHGVDALGNAIGSSLAAESQPSEKYALVGKSQGGLRLSAGAMQRWSDDVDRSISTAARQGDLPSEAQLDLEGHLLEQADARAILATIKYVPRFSDSNADLIDRIREKQSAILEAGGSSVARRLAPNKYDGYDLGTKEGMLNFVSDVAASKKLGLAVDDDMAATARQLARSYLGMKGSFSQIADQVDKMPYELIEKRFDKTVGTIVQGIKQWETARDHLVDASIRANVDAGVVVAIANFESKFNPDARPISSDAIRNTIRQFDGVMALSSAYGYGQFTDDTWLGSLKKYGENYGIADSKSLTLTQASLLRKDLSLQAGMLVEFTKANISLGRNIGGIDDMANVYALHNLGGRDGTKFLGALAATPDTPVMDVLSQRVIAGNQSLYGDGSISVQAAYDRMKSVMKLGEMYAAEARRLQLQRGK